MKIAVAMLCHKNTDQINALLRAMEHDDISFYIHIDKKSSLDRKKLVGKNVHVLNKDSSVNIQWGGFGMIDATLKLIKEISESGQDYDYVWLMSGQDFPLHTAKEIVEFFTQHNGEDFIEILQNDDAFNRGYFKRNDLYYPSWMVSDKIYVKIIKWLFWLLTGGRKATILFKRKTEIEHFYYGSQWWALSRQSIEPIIEFLSDNPWYLEYFRNSLVPDESFFQTLYGILYDASRAKPAVCFVSWKKNRNNPEILTSNDIKKIAEIKNSYLIARKFDFCVDSSVVKTMMEVGL